MMYFDLVVMLNISFIPTIEFPIRPAIHCLSCPLRCHGDYHSLDVALFQESLLNIELLSGQWSSPLKYSHQFWLISPTLLYPLKIWYLNFRTNIWPSSVCKRLVLGTSILSQDKLKKCAIVRCQACLKHPIAIPNPPISDRCNFSNTWRIRIKFDSVISKCQFIWHWLISPEIHMRILMQTTQGTLTSGSVSFPFTFSDYDSI
jgi:hypothetical protein